MSVLFGPFPLAPTFKVVPSDTNQEGPDFLGRGFTGRHTCSVICHNDSDSTTPVYTEQYRNGRDRATGVVRVRNTKKGTSTAEPTVRIQYPVWEGGPRPGGKRVLVSRV